MIFEQPIRIPVSTGTLFGGAAVCAATLAQQHNVLVSFEFNGCTLVAWPNASTDLEVTYLRNHYRTLRDWP